MPINEPAARTWLADAAEVPVWTTKPEVVGLPDETPDAAVLVPVAAALFGPPCAPV